MSGGCFSDVKLHAALVLFEGRNLELLIAGATWLSSFEKTASPEMLDIQDIHFVDPLKAFGDAQLLRKMQDQFMAEPNFGYFSDS